MRSMLFPLLLAPMVPMATAAVISFDTVSDYTSNFRPEVNLIDHTTESGNGFLRYTRPGGAPSQLATATYDLNGADAGNTTFSVGIGQSLTVTADVRLSADTASLGIIFNGGAAGHLALLNINDTGASGSDRLRIFDVGQLNGSTASSPGTTQTTFNSIDLNTFYTLNATYTVLTANSYSVSISQGSTVHTRTFLSATPLSNIQIGLRTSAVTGADTVDIDNFNAAVIPEPAAAFLGALGTLGLLRRRR